MLALYHCLFQFCLVLGEQFMNLAVRLVADRVNLRSKLLPRRFRILIEESLDPSGRLRASFMRLGFCG